MDGTLAWQESLVAEKISVGTLAWQELLSAEKNIYLCIGSWWIGFSKYKAKLELNKEDYIYPKFLGFTN